MPRLNMVDEKMTKLEELMERKFSKCMQGVNKNHEQMQKVSANALTTTSKIDLCYNKITGFTDHTATVDPARATGTTAVTSIQEITNVIMCR